MEWIPVLSALLGALAGAIVTVTPSVIRLLSGKVESDRQNRLDILAAHERFEVSMQSRLDDYRARLDKQQEKIEVLEQENGECKAANKYLQEQVDELKRRIKDERKDE